MNCGPSAGGNRCQCTPSGHHPGHKGGRRREHWWRPLSLPYHAL